MSTRLIRRGLAALLAVSTISMTTPLPSVAAGFAIVHGRVTGSDGFQPKAGVVVTLVDETGERTFRSTPTSAKGTFTIDSAPAGRYGLLVQSTEGAFVASGAVDLREGVNRPIALSLRPGKGRDDSGKAGSGTTGSKVPTWAKWVIAGGIIVGGLIVADAVTKNEDAASAF